VYFLAVAAAGKANPARLMFQLIAGRAAKAAVIV
jgi:hypothetical protein